MTKKIKTIADLTPDAANLNKGTERGRYLLETSVSKLGLGRSVLADKNGTLIAGNKTTEVAGELGMSKVRVIETDGTELIVVQRTDLDMTDPDDPRARQLAFADNQVGAQNLAWDAQALLAAAQADDLSDFVRDDELKAMIDAAQDEESNTGGNSDVDAEPQIDKAEELRAKWGVESGQMWRLGEHRIICGDCTDAAVVERVMGGEKADTMVSDPPYGIGYEYREHDDASNDDNLQLVQGAFANAPAARVWTCGLMNLARELVWNPGAKVLAWHKGFAQAGNGLGGAGTWEPVLVVDVKNGTLPNDYLHFSTDREPGLRELHSCPKPVALFSHLIEHLAGRTVYEPFSGSGTTIIACEQLGRKCRAIEISPAYVAVALQRWADATGKTPKLLQ